MTRGSFYPPLGVGNNTGVFNIVRGSSQLSPRSPPLTSRTEVRGLQSKNKMAPVYDLPLAAATDDHSGMLGGGAGLSSQEHYNHPNINNHHLYATKTDQSPRMERLGKSARKPRRFSANMHQPEEKENNEIVRVEEVKTKKKVRTLKAGEANGLQNVPRASPRPKTSNAYFRASYPRNGDIGLRRHCPGRMYESAGFLLG